MVATLALDERNGADPGTETPGVANANYGRLDLPNMVPGNATQLIVPPAGSVWSFEKWHRIRVVAMNGAMVLDNLRFWKVSGALKAGETLWFNLLEGSEVDDAYATPVDTDSAVATETFVAAMPGAPNLYTGIGAGSDELNADGEQTHHIVSQLEIASTTELGDLNQKVFRVRWDEV